MRIACIIADFDCLKNCVNFMEEISEISRVLCRPPWIFYKNLEHPADHGMNLKFLESPLKKFERGW